MVKHQFCAKSFPLRWYVWDNRFLLNLSKCLRFPLVISILNQITVSFKNRRTHGYTFHKTYYCLFSTRQTRINLLCSPVRIEFDYLRESQSAGQKTTNQTCHCHGYTRFLQPENKVLILAVYLRLFNGMFSR